RLDLQAAMHREAERLGRHPPNSSTPNWGSATTQVRVGDRGLPWRVARPIDHRRVDAGKAGMAELRHSQAGS
ncbi:MAG: hypothetical protein PVF70_09990, partial [Anaerolineales bacterium]